MNLLKSLSLDFFFKKEDLELIQAHEAVDVAIETVSQKTSVFELRQLKEYALKHTLTGNECISHKAIEEVINEKIKNQSLYVGRDPQTQQPALTTPWLLTLEAESLARIETNKGQVKPITTIKEVHNFQSNYEANAKYPWKCNISGEFIDIGVYWGQLNLLLDCQRVKTISHYF